jgi:hypothetical protein
MRKLVRQAGESLGSLEREAECTLYSKIMDVSEPIDRVGRKAKDFLWKTGKRVDYKSKEIHDFYRGSSEKHKNILRLIYDNRFLVYSQLFNTTWHALYSISALCHFIAGEKLKDVTLETAIIATAALPFGLLTTGMYWGKLKPELVVKSFKEDWRQTTKNLMWGNVIGTAVFYYHVARRIVPHACQTLYKDSRTLGEKIPNVL